MTEDSIILGVESSCDETGCSLVAGGRRVLSNIVSSQIDMHRRFGGVVPEIASRAHLEAINTVIADALQEAGISRDDISGVAVASEPGLIGSLLVGLMAAKALAWAWRMPLFGVNHIHAHAYAPCLDSEPIEYPATALICSGGHTSLYQCTSPTELELLGSTIDDAAGEAFDKVSSILQLGYPGGPAIDKAARNGDPSAVNFPRSLLSGDSLDFSFSGLKTAVLYHVNGVPNSQSREDRPWGIEHIPERAVLDIAASFQQAVVDVLITKIRRAWERKPTGTLIIGGGVAANSALREAASNLAQELGIEFRRPEMKYCTDNAAMIAGLAFYSQPTGLDLAATATVRR
jgi:N6-L-threonylcarbamoyladenine synthase